MRITGILVLVLLAAPLRAQGGPDAATAHVPKSSVVCIRLPSLERAEVIRKDVIPLLAAIDGLEELAEKPLAQLLAEELGVDMTWIDASKPVYVAVTDDDAVLILPAKEGTALEGVKDLEDGTQVVQHGAFLVVGEPEQLEKETRGTATELLPGDIVVHVFLSELVDRHKDDIEQGFQQAAQMAAFSGLPAPLVALVEPLLSVARGVVYGVGPFTYAITWKGDHAESEGYFQTRPESGMRAFFAGAGAGGANDLAGYLPEDALVTTDFFADPGWPAGQIAAVAEETFGEGIGKALTQIFGPTYALAPKLTGRAAFATRLQGMMGNSTLSIVELKEGVDAATVFDGYDVAAANEALKKLGAPLSFTFSRNTGKHGETALHSMSMQSDDPNLGMIAMMFQYTFAAEGRHMFMTQGLTAETDMRSLLDTVRAGTKKETAHTKAMARLGPSRNMGITFNVGALKPMAGMFAMMDPAMGQFFMNFPDTMNASTALSITRDGNLRWKGDWPVKEILKLVDSAAAAAKKAEEPPPDEEFD